MKQPEPFGKYLLLGQVAVGGMAEIYKARYADPSYPQVDIALKRILPSYTEDESFVTMFKDEGNIAIRLNHPNIVKVYEVGEVNNDWYIAMEYVHGTDIRILSDACEKYNKRFTATQIARIACETAKALDYAHKSKADDGTPLNIVHRDCTPHNIMVSQAGEIKLMDFGIAKAASRATKTRVGTVKGKSSYMSPEQARGKQLDGRSDMFTLGTVAWELLTSYRLFKASSDFEVLTKVLKAELIHPSDIDSNIPRDLGDIIMKTLERDRDRRYADCGEFANALDNWLAVNGDGSDQRLGGTVLCLTNKQGHSFSELPNYTPGLSLYDYVDGNFVKKAGAPHSTLPYNPPAVAPAPAQTMVPEPAPYPAPGFPDPSIGAQTPAGTRLPTSFVIAFAILILVSIGAVLGSIHVMKTEVAEVTGFQVPDALINIKTHPTNATVKLNDKNIQDEHGDAAQTPVYSYKAKLGEKYKFTFEKAGFETVTVEREINLLNQDIEISLTSEEEARTAKLDAFPDFTINTEPSGALIKVNGEDVGKSPVTIHNVKFGEDIEVEVAMDGKDSKIYQPTKRTYTALKGGEPQMNVVLEKVETAVAVAAPAPAPEKTKQTAEAPKAKPKTTNTAAANDKKSNTPGSISVKAVPWATVNIDGQRVGTTPIKKDGIKPGSHKVELRFPTKNLTRSKSVTLKSGQNLNIGYNFNEDKWM